MQDDEIILNEGFSTVYGGYGNDIILSRAKADEESKAILTGGAGIDTYIIGHSKNVATSGQTYVQDF